MHHEKTLFTNEEAASYIGVTPGTLNQWRHNNRYSIPFIRVGALVRYRRADLDRWLESRTVRPGSAMAAASMH